MASGAVPVTLIVLILPVPFTASTFTIASCVGLFPPKFVPNICNLSPAAYPEVASAAVPELLNPVIPPEPFTPVTVIVKSFVGLCPPNVVPLNIIVLPAT